MFNFGIITVPEREEALKLVTDELDKRSIGYNVFVDREHKGQPYNFDRMLEFYCDNDYHQFNVVLCTDDIIFNDNFFDKLDKVLQETDYDVIGTYSNKIQNEKNDLYNGTGKHCLYDPCVCYRKGVLCEDYYKYFHQYATNPKRTTREHNHYDVMNSHFLRDYKYKICVIRPNLIKLQKIKSTLNHNVKIAD